MRPDHLQKWLEDMLEHADKASEINPPYPVIGAPRASIEEWTRENESIKSVKIWLGNVKQYNHDAARNMERIVELMKEAGFETDGDHLAFWHVLADLVKAGIKAKPIC